MQSIFSTREGLTAEDFRIEADNDALSFSTNAEQVSTTFTVRLLRDTYKNFNDQNSLQFNPPDMASKLTVSCITK
jgi:hypothetical protein